MKILVTGGAGFLGLHISRFAERQGHDLTLLDIADFNKKEYSSRFEFIKGDIRDKELMKKVTQGKDAVIHAAAALPLWKDNEIRDININGTENLLKNSFENKVKKFIYISSTAVYGVPIKHPIVESDPLIGVGAYGESKIAAEKLCRQYRERGMTVSIIRPKTFVGTHRLGVFEILFDWIKDGKRIPVIGNGGNRYQLLDVNDLVEVIYLLIVTKEKKTNSEFNIGAAKFETVEKDLNRLFDYAFEKKGKIGKKSSIFPTPAVPVKTFLYIFEKLKLSPLYRWVYDTADKDSFVSIEKLSTTLKWHPKYSNSEALIKSYQWYLDNYKKIKSKKPGITHTVGWNQGILGFFKKFL